ncbi:MAG: sodium:proton antiporter [Deltaproteobacteria bacterium]|nr:sodium:proton antiporter [Deltaproteobacteria bacterium]
MRKGKIKWLHVVIGTLLVILAFPASGFGAEPHLPGQGLGAYWIIPFVCMLLSIAVCPLTVPHFWEHNFGKVAVFWGLAFLVPCALVYGPATALFEAWHAIILDYVPFIILLLSLFTVAGGVRLTGSLVGTPLVNTGILLIGALLASWMGTTGAAMLLIRPMLRANAHRRYKVHSVVFFIFLVANIGGCLTPLGDPPLFLGFLKGVSFFWTFTHLLPMLLVEAGLLLVVYFILETVLYNREGRPVPPAEETEHTEKLGLEGKVNLLLLLGIVLTVLLSGSVNFGSVEIYHVSIPLQNVMQNVLLLLLAALSLKLTSRESRRRNNFTWAPILEVGKLFFGIFLSMIPALAILRAGEQGALHAVISLVTHEGQPVNPMYFWLTGSLSSFLDNAPTYLVFFNTAGGDPVTLMGPMAETLAAISAGAVFMGANTYIGNAPNFMVRSIAENQGVRMPSFFGYMAWSVAILVPSFVLLTFIFIN